MSACVFFLVSLSLSLSLSTFSSSAIPSSFGPSFGLPARCCWSLLLLVPLTAATDKAKASHGQTNDDAMAGRTPTADRWRLDRETTTTLAARHTRTRKWRTRENGGAATLTGRVGGGGTEFYGSRVSSTTVAGTRCTRSDVPPGGGRTLERRGNQPERPEPQVGATHRPPRGQWAARPPPVRPRPRRLCCCLAVIGSTSCRGFFISDI